MKTIIKGELLILIPETPAETAELSAWKAGREGYVLAVHHNAGPGISLGVLGPREEVCNEPIQVSSRSPDPRIQLIGNLAMAPFKIDGIEYASVEGFWQGLKFPEGSERRRVASLSGPEAKRAGAAIDYGETVSYQGKSYRVGTWEHWQLMRLACDGKFHQNWEAQSALVSTGTRPLVHQMRRDSKTIPGAIMAEIWMRIRRNLVRGTETEDQGDDA